MWAVGGTKGLPGGAVGARQGEGKEGKGGWGEGGRGREAEAVGQRWRSARNNGGGKRNSFFLSFGHINHFFFLLLSSWFMNFVPCVITYFIT